MIENTHQQPNLIASFSGVSGGGSNSPSRRLALPGMRGLSETPFEPVLHPGGGFFAS